MNRNLRTATVLLIATSAACEVPNFEGPQVQTPPPAFFLQDESYQQRRMFDHLDPIYHDAWVETADGHFSGIFINGYSGTLEMEDVMAAQDSARVHAATFVRFGEIESITIDERPAWAWAEIRQNQQIGVDWIAYRAMIPYDTISYVVEFHGGEPGLKAKPDTLRTIVASFGIGKTTWNYPLIAVLFGSLLLGVSVLRARAQERQRRLQGIALKTIPKKEDPEAEASAAEGALRADAPTAPAATASSGAATSAPTPGTEAATKPVEATAPAPKPAPTPAEPESIAAAVARAAAEAEAARKRSSAVQDLPDFEIEAAPDPD